MKGFAQKVYSKSFKQLFLLAMPHDGRIAQGYNYQIFLSVLADIRGTEVFLALAFLQVHY